MMQTAENWSRSAAGTRRNFASVRWACPSVDQGCRGRERYVASTR
jgi:hypothetical protein